MIKIFLGFVGVIFALGATYALYLILIELVADYKENK